MRIVEQLASRKEERKLHVGNSRTVLLTDYSLGMLEPPIAAIYQGRVTNET
jgi:hypothetical protein